MSLEQLTEEINRVHNQQTGMWRSKLKRLQEQRDELQSRNKQLRDALSKAISLLEADSFDISEIDKLKKTMEGKDE